MVNTAVQNGARMVNTRHLPGLRLEAALRAAMINNSNAVTTRVGNSFAMAELGD